MKKANIVILSLVMSVLFLITGCSGGKTSDNNESETSQKSESHESADETKGNGNKEIGAVFADLNNPVFVDMKTAIEDVCDEQGYALTVLNSEGSAEKEVQNVQNLISKGVSAIVLLANDSDSAVNSAKYANEAEVPIVAMNRPVNNKAGEATFVTQVITDNITAGKMAADFANELVADIDAPKIAIMRGTLGVASDLERYEGFLEGIKGTKLENAVVTEQSGNYNTQDGYTAMQNMIQANPDIDLVYCENDTMAVGAQSVLESSGKTNVLIIGVDGSEEVIQAVVDGKISGTIAQKFFTMGRTSTEWAIKAAEGKSADAPEIELIDTDLVTSENAETYERQ